MQLIKSLNKFQKILFVPAILIHFILLINTRFTLWPEMVVYPYLLNNNFILYRDIITNYSPIFIYALSFLNRIFGYQPLVFQNVTFLTILIIDLCIYYFAKRLFGTKEANISLIFFIALSIPFGINGLWFDLIITPFILSSLFLFVNFLKKPQTKTLFYCFLLLAVAFFIKQQTIWLYIWYLIIAAFRFRRKIKFVLVIVAVSILPFLSFLAFFVFFFAKKQILGDYLFWNFGFPFTIASPGAGYNELPALRQLITLIALFLLFIPSFFKKQTETRLVLTISLLLMAFAYRFDFFHLIPSLATLSLIAGFNLKRITESGKKVLVVLVPSTILVLSFSLRHIAIDWQEPTRFFEPDILSTAKFIKLITPANVPIYIQNAPYQLLPMSGRLPAKPWIAEFSWYLELPGNQEKVVQALKDQKPKYVISKPYENKGQFNLGSYRPKLIADYIDSTYQEYFKLSDALLLKKLN